MQNIGISPGKAGSQDNLSYMYKRTQKVYGLWNFEWKYCHNPTGNGIIAAETLGTWRIIVAERFEILDSWGWPQTNWIELVRQSYSSSESDYPSNLSKPCWIPKNLDCPSTRWQESFEFLRVVLQQSFCSWSCASLSHFSRKTSQKSGSCTFRNGGPLSGALLW